MPDNRAADRRVIEDLLNQGILQRVEVGEDLGPVYKGDHIIIVSKRVVAVDTSRRPEVPAPAFPKPVAEKSRGRPSRRGDKTKLAKITRSLLIETIRKHQPITSLYLSDVLGFARNDVSARSKVTSLLRMLQDSQQIRRHKDERLKLFRYEVADSASNSA